MRTLLVGCLSVLLSLALTAQDAEAPISLDSLRAAIGEILEQTHTPAAGIALVDSSGTVWAGSIGKADLEAERPADAETMYRIGSVSKLFDALAVLKLQEEGRLRLNDKVRDLAPEIAFTH